MAYDVGAIVAATQAEFNLFANRRNAVDKQRINRATPENLELLLGELLTFTDELVAWRQSMEGNVSWRMLIDEATLESIDGQLSRWQERLDGYIFEVSKAPAGDRKDVLWSTTAPLLLGFYGGENDKSGQRPADVGTPFSIANQMLVSDEWMSASFEAFQSDIIAEAVEKYTKVVEILDDVAELPEDLFGSLKYIVPIGIGLGIILLIRGR